MRVRRKVILRQTRSPRTDLSAVCVLDEQDAVDDVFRHVLNAEGREDVLKALKEGRNIVEGHDPADDVHVTIEWRKESDL